ncbi:MAG: VWA domain-containing protein [Planctomycetales bacterium]|nr:VWA domain-containing protein [Planctomycetales bacterium]
MSTKLTVIPGSYETHNLADRGHLVLVCDWSGSMEKYKQAMDQAFENMVHQCTDSIGLRQSLEIAVCDFSSRVQFRDFAPPPHYQEPQPAFSGGGYTMLGAALSTTIEMTQQRRAMQRADGIHVVRTVCVVLSDGQASDLAELESAKQKIGQMEDSEEIEFIPLLIKGMHLGPLEHIFDRVPIPVDAMKFDVLFAALCRSMSQHSVVAIESDALVYEMLLLEYENSDEDEHE